MIHTPLGYYTYLRRQGYFPRTAWACTLMRFSKTGEELKRRLNRGKRTRRVVNAH